MLLGVGCGERRQGGVSRCVAEDGSADRPREQSHDRGVPLRRRAAPLPSFLPVQGTASFPRSRACFGFGCQAHIEAGMLVGLPFASSEPFDFKTSGMATKVQRHAAIFAEHRLTPPPKVSVWHRWRYVAPDGAADHVQSPKLPAYAVLCCVCCGPGDLLVAQAPVRRVLHVHPPRCSLSSARRSGRHRGQPRVGHSTWRRRRCA